MRSNVRWNQHVLLLHHHLVVRMVVMISVEHLATKMTTTTAIVITTTTIKEANNSLCVVIQPVQAILNPLLPPPQDLPIPIMIVKKMIKDVIIVVENVGADWKTRKIDVEQPVIVKKEDVHVITMMDLAIEMMIIIIITIIVVVIMIENATIEMIVAVLGNEVAVEATTAMNEEVVDGIEELARTVIKVE